MTTEKHPDDSDGSKSDNSNVENMSIFQRFMKMVTKVLDVFKNQPLFESPDSYKIETKYPKYIPEYSLIHLQFNDFQFRQTLMTQILILMQSLQNPVNMSQTKCFKIHDAKSLQDMKSRICKLLSNELEPQKNNKNGLDAKYHKQKGKTYGNDKRYYRK